jgi:hypothetical protein
MYPTDGIKSFHKGSPLVLIAYTAPSPIPAQPVLRFLKPSGRTVIEQVETRIQELTKDDLEIQGWIKNLDTITG